MFDNHLKWSEVEVFTNIKTKVSNVVSLSTRYVVTLLPALWWNLFYDWCLSSYVVGKYARSLSKWMAYLLARLSGFLFVILSGF